MQITVNGQCETSPAPGATLGAVVADLRRSAKENGRVVAGLLLDGAILTPEREDECASEPIVTFKRLEAEVTEPRELIRRVFGGIGGALQALSIEARETAGKIRVGGRAQPFIGRVAEQLGFLVDAYRHGMRLLITMGKVEKVPPPPQTLPVIERVLGEVLASLRAADPVRVSDALEHELRPALLKLEVELQDWIRALEPPSVEQRGIEAHSNDARSIEPQGVGTNGGAGDR